VGFDGLHAWRTCEIDELSLVGLLGLLWSLKGNCFCLYSGCVIALLLFVHICSLEKFRLNVTT